MPFRRSAKSAQTVEKEEGFQSRRATPHLCDQLSSQGMDLQTLQEQRDSTTGALRQGLHCAGTRVMTKPTRTDVRGSYAHTVEAIESVLSSSRRKK